LELEMAKAKKRRNPFEGKVAVPVWEFLDKCSRWQLIIFNKKRANDPHFDWYLTINGKMRVRPGTPWKANSGKINSWVEPWVMLSESGEPLFIRPCTTFGDTISVVPLRKSERGLEIGVVVQRRPFRGIMGGMLRKFSEPNEDKFDTVRRIVPAETGYKVRGSLITLPSFNVDASYLPVSQPLFAVFVEELIPNFVPPSGDMILGTLWLTVKELLDRFYSGTYFEKIGMEQVLVDYCGAIEWMPLLLALAHVPELRAEFAKACLD
jgi:hypothetical protein